MTQFSWQVDGMLQADEAGREGVVTSIRWTLVAEAADGRTAEVKGTLTPPMPEAGAEFTALADLTQAQVEAWLEAMPIAAEVRAEAQARLDPPPLVQIGGPQLVLPPWLEGKAE